MTSLIISTFLTLSTLLHVGQLAEYHIYQENDKIHMKVVLEKDEMLRLNFKSKCDTQNMTVFCVSNYILDNLTIEINNTLVKFELGDSYTENGHLIIYLAGELKQEKVTKVKLKTNCFYEFYPNYRNRIIFDMGYFQNSYLLTKANNTISFK